MSWRFDLGHDAAATPSARARSAFSFTDITGHKQAEDALHKSNQLKQQIIAGAKEDIIVYNREGRTDPAEMPGNSMWCKPCATRIAGRVGTFWRKSLTAKTRPPPQIPWT